jgi:GTP cyclohydrolase I
MYPVPDGGIPAAQLVESQGPALLITEHLNDAHVYVDDIIDSGSTRKQFREQSTGNPRYIIPDDRPFYALVDKQGADKEWLGEWVSFPWERMQRKDGPQDNIKRLLQFIGEDPWRPGLLETPDRVVASFKEIYGGYKANPEELVKTFESDCDEMVVLQGIEFYSTCEHHMMPFFGTADIAYIPSGKVLGVSKLARLLEVYSRRLQIQERLTTKITSWLDANLKPLGSACRLTAQHLCMTARGVGKQHSTMVTSSLTGVFRERPEVRQEFFSLVNGK